MSVLLTHNSRVRFCGAPASLCFIRKALNFADIVIVRSMFKRIFTLLLLGLLAVAQAQDGAALLKKYGCTSCHKMDQKMTGPALQGAVERWQGDKAEMKKMIQLGAAEYAKTGAKGAYVQGLIDELKQVMAPHAFVPEADIDNILTYIETYTPPVASAEPAPGAGAAPAGQAAVEPGDTILYGLVVLVGLLVLITLVLVVVIAAVLSAIRARERGEKFTYGTLKDSATGLIKNKFVLTLIGLIIVGGVLDKGYNFVAHIGFHDGYQPVQPIPFSHALHAGQYQINCLYCHTGADKSKSATIPSTNICMNCHADGAIAQGPSGNSQILDKVRAAHNEGRAIEWVRIHNLPDLVYFNHSQHVKVGGLECQTCHGPVQEMEEVYQFSRLTMAWCVSCHREKAVKFNDNAYYQHVYHNVRNDLQEGRIDSVTVARLGGLECQRCHY
jgi:cytochrome c551/c552